MARIMNGSGDFNGGEIFHVVATLVVATSIGGEMHGYHHTSHYSLKVNFV